MHKRLTAIALAAALVAASCGGGDDDDTTSNARVDDSIVEPSGGVDARIEAVSASFVWAIDGEPLGPTFDYSDPIERERLAAGMQLEVLFDISGGDGIDLDPGLFVRTEINGDAIDPSGQSVVGEERARTGPDFDGVTVERTAAGAVVRYDFGAPLSPISLERQRADAEAFGLSVDDEVIDFEDTDLQFDAANILDFAAAPIDGVNRYEIEVSGSVSLGGAMLDDIDLSTSLTVEEDRGGWAPPSVCAAAGTRYADELATAAAMPETVQLARLRWFDQAREFAVERECPPSEFAVLVCEAGDLAARSLSDEVMEPHVAVCPDEDAVAAELAEQSDIAPVVADGVITTFVPRSETDPTRLAITLAVPAAWNVTVARDEPGREEIAIDSGDQLAIEITVKNQGWPASLIDAELDGTQTTPIIESMILRTGEVDVGGRSALHQLSRRVSNGGADYELVAQVGDERIIRIGALLDPDGLTDAQIGEFFDCFIASIDITEFDDEPPVIPPPTPCPAPVFGASEQEPAPVIDDADPAPATTVEPTTEDPAERAVSGFADGVATVVVPALRDNPSHVIAVAAPTDWTLDRIDDGSASQIIELSGPESLSAMVVRAGFASDVAARLDERAQPLSEDWIVVRDDMVETAAVGEAIRVVVTEREFSDGSVARRVKLLGALDEERLYDIRLTLGGESSLDFGIEVQRLLDTLSIGSG